MVEFIDGQSEAKSSSKNLAVALEGHIGATSTQKERRSLAKKIGPAVEALGEAMTKMRKSSSLNIERNLKEVVAKR